MQFPLFDEYVRFFFVLTAAVYGRGAYFARDAYYSARDTYTPRNQNGHKFMYLARVLTGQFTVGNAQLVVPPSINPQQAPDVLYDSVVDDVNNPQIFVSFHDTHTYPEYLIVFD